MDSPDVVVIGGGIAGASVAYELAADRSVLLLEADAELAKHSTARSAATYVPGHGGPEQRALIAASGPRFARLEAELETPPLLAPRDVIQVAFDDEGEQVLARILAERAGEPDCPQAIDAAETLRRSPALAPGIVRAAAVAPGSADVDVDALHQGYIRGLRRRGGSVRTGAPAKSLVRSGSGWRVDTGADVIDTGLLVDAAGAWADEVAERAGVPRIGITPMRRTIGVARVPDPAMMRGPDQRPPMIIEVTYDFYFKPDGDDLLVCPGDETPTAPGDARPDELDVAIALERVAAVTRLGLRSIRTSWAGLRSFVPDRKPVIGVWPQHPGFAFVAGQGGAGIETAPALAAFAAAVITGAQTPADVPLDPAVLSPARS